MSVSAIVLLGGFAVLFVYAVIIYNGLVRLKNNYDRAFANIEVLLKQRHTELPRLVEICKGYMQHERELLVNLVNARSRVHDAQEDRNIPELGKAEGQLRTSLDALFIRVEAYPELKADKNMLALHERITQLEDAIADRREMFNESVRLNNTRIQQFPDTFLARLFKFGEVDYLRFEAHAMAPINIGPLIN